MSTKMNMDKLRKLLLSNDEINIKIALEIIVAESDKPHDTWNELLNTLPNIEPGNIFNMDLPHNIYMATWYSGDRFIIDVHYCKDLAVKPFNDEKPSYLKN